MFLLGSPVFKSRMCSPCEKTSKCVLWHKVSIRKLMFSRVSDAALLGMETIQVMQPFSLFWRNNFCQDRPRCWVVRPGIVSTWSHAFDGREREEAPSIGLNSNQKIPTSLYSSLTLTTPFELQLYFHIISLVEKPYSLSTAKMHTNRRLMDLFVELASRASHK